jgi:hypothetical protein
MYVDVYVWIGSLTTPLGTKKDPDREDVKFHGDGESQVQRYRFNTKEKDQMFCGKCGASLGIDFRDSCKPEFGGYGISVSLLPKRGFSSLSSLRERESVCVCVHICVCASVGGNG